MLATSLGCPLSVGSIDISNAAAPATCGAAMLVPVSDA